MPQPLAYLRETPSQTAGPYVHIGMMPSVAGLEGVYADPGQAIIGPETPGQRIRITGAIFDGDGNPVRDAAFEIWQADGNGIYNSPVDPQHERCATGFTGWGRFSVDLKNGSFGFETIKPGPVPGPKGTMMAPHIAFWVVARGINLGLNTRLYFADETAANASDPILQKVGMTGRAWTLLAQGEKAEGDAPIYRFDIHLQGDKETVFFAS